MPDFVLFIPTLALICGAGLLLLADLLPYPDAKNWVALGSVGAALASVLSLSRRSWPMEAALFTWLPGAEDMAPVAFTYYLDAISFALLVCSLFVAVGLTLYANSYVATEPRRQLAFYFVVLLAAAAFVNMILAGNLLIAYISLQAWLVTTFVAMAFWHHGPESTAAIARSFVLASLPSTGVLLAALTLASRNPNLAFSAISPQSVAPLLLFLFLLAAAAVSYQYPFHPWTAVSFRMPLPAAALLSMVFAPWAGVYLLGRFQMLSGPQIQALWHQSLLVIGSLTMLAGAVYALKQTHLRGVAIFVATAQFGYAFLGLGINTPASISAAFLILVSSTLSACGLMICAGMVERCAGTGSVLKLGGLVGHMPRTTMLFAFFSLTLAGVPLPTVGFFAKWVMLGAAVESGHTAFGILTLVVDVLVFVMLMRTMDWTFFRNRYRGALAGKEDRGVALTSAGLLAFPVLFFGLTPFWLMDWLIKPAVAVISHVPVADLKVSLAGGFASAGFWSSSGTFLLMVLPPVLGLIAYMIALGNGSSQDIHRAHDGQTVASQTDQPAEAVEPGRTMWFPWVINTSEMYASGWQLLLFLTRTLRSLISPTEASYSTLAILLAALTIVLALLE